MEKCKMNRQIYSCPDYNNKLDTNGKPIKLSIHESDSTWINKMVNAPTSKRKPIILKRGRSSWPVSSNGKNQKNIRDTCRGSAGAAESLDDRKFTSHGEFISRRNSFLYRSDSLNSKYFTRGISAKSSVCHMEQQLNKSQDIVVTPFAQILLTLRLVKSRLIQMFHLKGKSSDNKLENRDNDEINFAEDTLPSVTDTLSNLEWCLYQLENVQTHRSVSELATSKFKRLLSRELIQKNSKNGNKNICDFICQTFMDEVPYISEEHLDDVLFNQYNWKSGENFNLESPNVEKDILNTGQMSDLTINEWGPDIFQLTVKNPGCILKNLTMSIFEIRKMFSTLKLDITVVNNFLIAVENSYRSTNTYHNSIHAADVVQSVHVIISMVAFKNVFSDLEVFSALLSAVIHDIDHPGVTNQFLINTNNSLAILYNDISVLENHHLAVGFTIMKREDCNILASFSRSQQQVIRRMVIDMVLATDMSKHMTMLADLKTMVETKKVSGSGILNLDNYNDRIQILQNLIHCADLSNPTKSINLYMQWTERVMDEFFSQGDKEKELGIENSPMCDRLTASIAKSQVSFIDFIVYPLWETWADLVQPEANIMLNNLLENRQYYEKISIDNESNCSD